MPSPRHLKSPSRLRMQRAVEMPGTGGTLGRRAVDVATWPCWVCFSFLGTDSFQNQPNTGAIFVAWTSGACEKFVLDSCLAEIRSYIWTLLPGAGQATQFGQFHFLDVQLSLFGFCFPQFAHGSTVLSWPCLEWCLCVCVRVWQPRLARPAKQWR